MDPCNNLGLAGRRARRRTTKQPAAPRAKSTRRWARNSANIGTLTTFEISRSIYDIFVVQPCSRRRRISRLKLHGAAIRADIAHHRGGRQNCPQLFCRWISRLRSCTIVISGSIYVYFNGPTVFYAAPHHFGLGPCLRSPVLRLVLWFARRPAQTQNIAG